MATSPHYDILLTIRDIAAGGMTTESLANRRGVGERTIKSYIAQARHLGADIRSFKANGVYCWNLVNFARIEDRLNTWIELEENALKDIELENEEFDFSRSYPNIDNYLKTKKQEVTNTEVTDFHKQFVHDTGASELRSLECYTLAYHTTDGRWRVEVEGVSGIWHAVPAFSGAPFGDFATWDTLESLQSAWRPVLGFDITPED